LGVLEAVITAVADADDLDVALQGLLAATVEPLEFVSGAIYLTERDGAVAAVAGAHRAADKAFLEAHGRLAVDDEPQAEVLRRGGGLFVSDCSKVAAFSLFEMPYGSGAAVPLVAHGVILGMLALGGLSVREYPPEQRSLLLDVGRLAGSVVSHLQALRELRESRQRYESLFHNAEVGIFRTRVADGAMVEANPRLAEIFGYGPGEEITFAPPRAHAMHGAEERRTAAVRELDPGGPAVSREIEMRRKDGTPVWLHYEASVSADGEHVDGVMLDVSVQHDAAAALRESEQRFRRLAENAPAIIYRYRLDPPGFEYVSPAATAMTGYTPEDHYADPDLGMKLVHPDDRGLLDALRSGAGDPTAPLTLRWVRKDGVAIWTEQRNTVVCDDAGTPLAIEGIALDISERRRAEQDALVSAARLATTLEGAMEAMGSVVEIRDPYTAGHQRRATALACEIAARMVLPEDVLNGLRLAGSVHDIGQLAVPAEILTKPGRLSEIEFDLVRVHASAGQEVVEKIRFDQPVADIVGQHHERLDGSGYPQGLCGEAILLEARILAVADVVEAMASHRPYRPALGVDAALAEVTEGAGRLYDPVVVATCQDVFAAGFSFPD
jgi:PAS domain S-box-containing protein